MTLKKLAKLMKNESNTEEIKEIIEELDFNQPSYTFTPSGRHTYRQEGAYLICKTCELHHAVFIGMDKLMVGEDENGNPIVKNRKEVGF